MPRPRSSTWSKTAGRRAAFRKIKNEWVWEIDWFGVGLKLVHERRTAGFRETPDALFKTYRQWVVSAGVEQSGTGRAPTRDIAVLEFNAAWAYVSELGHEVTAPA